MKRSSIPIIIGGGFAAITVFFLVSFLPIISTSEKYHISVDPIVIKDEMGTETHVAIRNTGTDTLTNIIVDYGGSTKPDIIPTLQPGEKISLSPPEGSGPDVHITTEQGINITKEYRTPASASFVGNSGYGG